MFELIVIAAFGTLVVTAGMTDLISLRIPNKVSAALALAFFPVALISGASWELIGTNLLIGGAVLAVAVVLFALKVLGAGDGKLIAALSLWFGYDHLLGFLFATSVAGGVLCLAIIAYRMRPQPVFLIGMGWADQLHTPAKKIPYGLAIAAGALLELPNISWLLA